MNYCQQCGVEIPEGRQFCSRSHALVWRNKNAHPKQGTASPMRRTPEYSTWKAIRNRCNNTNGQDFDHYGGRGIRVCERWDTFANFLEDMGRKPTPAHEIDRIDNDGNYEPGNCRWATRQQQRQNMPDNVNLTFRGKTQCVAEWTRELGLPTQVIYKRLYRGWSVEDALGLPGGQRGNKEFKRGA